MNKYDYDTGVSSSPVQETTNNVVPLTAQGNENPPQDSQPAEARGALRRRVLKSGQIEINQNYAEIPCRIKNLSETGALIEVVEKYIVPDKFNLAIPMDGCSVQCQVVRRNGVQIGLQFFGEKQKLVMEKTQSIRSSSDPYLERLIRKDVSVADAPSDTEQAIRRHDNQPSLSKPGFGRR